MAKRKREKSAALAFQTMVREAYGRIRDEIVRHAPRESERDLSQPDQRQERQYGSHPKGQEPRPGAKRRVVLQMGALPYHEDPQAEERESGDLIQSLHQHHPRKTDPDRYSLGEEPEAGARALLGAVTK